MYEVLIGYMAGTIVTGFIVWRFVSNLATEATVNVLADTGYIKHKYDAEGEITIYKLDEEVK